jgi:hypothetical protein
MSKQPLFPEARWRAQRILHILDLLLDKAGADALLVLEADVLTRDLFAMLSAMEDLHGQTVGVMQKLFNVETDLRRRPINPDDPDWWLFRPDDQNGDNR